MNIPYKNNRRKMNFSEIMEKPWLSSIINLTELYDQGDGLRPIHYRWALIPKHDGIKSTNDIAAMKKFFEYKKEDPSMEISKLGITEGSITSKTNLSNFLKRLVNDYHILTVKEGKYKITKYKINPEIQGTILRYRINRILSRFSTEELQEIDKIIGDLYFKKLDESIKSMMSQSSS